MKYWSFWSVSLLYAWYCIWLVGISCPISLPNSQDDLCLPEASQCPLYLWFRDNKHNHQQTALSLESISVVISLIYNENNTGPRTVPWGTPDKTGAQSDFIPFTTTRCCLKQRNRVFPPIPYPYSLHLSSSCRGVSKAFSKSKINVSTCPPLSKILAQSFITVINWVSQLCLFRNACCLSVKSLCSSKCAMILERTMCSSNLHGTQVRETGR